MTKEEKQLIYNLLKTTDDYINGYQRQCFAGEVIFQDDAVPSSKIIEQENQADNNIIIEDNSNVFVPGHERECPKKETYIQKDCHETSQQNTKPMEANISASMPEPDNVANPHNSRGNITIEQLNKKILRCTRCGLSRTRHNAVPGEGVCNPDVFIIGEGPGHDEDLQGRPFVGRAGMLLDKMLHAINLDRNTNCFIGNIVKCRPPENRNPFPDEEEACFSYLEKQINILKPKMILCLGKVAIEKLMKRKISINASHGRFFEYKNIPVMVTYHPSALLRNESLKAPAWEDLKAFRRNLNDIIQRSTTSI